MEEENKADSSLVTIKFEEYSGGLVAAAVTIKPLAYKGQQHKSRMRFRREAVNLCSFL